MRFPVLQKTKSGTGLSYPAGSVFWISIAYDFKNFIRTSQFQRSFLWREHRGKIIVKDNNPGSNICAAFGNWISCGQMFNIMLILYIFLYLYPLFTQHTTNFMQLSSLLATETKRRHQMRQAKLRCSLIHFPNLLFQNT